jgi:hypothetical protein
VKHVELDESNYKQIDETDVFRALISNSSLGGLTNQHFKQILLKKSVIQQVAFNIYSKVKSQQFDINQLEELLKMCDKDLFVMFRDGVITYNQL